MPLPATLTPKPMMRTRPRAGIPKPRFSEMINNPLGELWLLFVQNDMTWYDGDAPDFLGEDSKIFNTTYVEPSPAFSKKPIFSGSLFGN